MEFDFSISIKDHNFVYIVPNAHIYQCEPMDRMLLQASSHDWWEHNSTKKASIVRSCVMGHVSTKFNFHAIFSKFSTNLIMTRGNIKRKNN